MRILSENYQYQTKYLLIDHVCDCNSKIRYKERYHGAIGLTYDFVCDIDYLPERADTCT